MSVLAIAFAVAFLAADTTGIQERIDRFDPLSGAYVGAKTSRIGPDGKSVGDFPSQSPGFDFLLGSWVGVLEYLDYGDDETLVTLPTRLACRLSDASRPLVLEFSFEEPDGRVISSNESLFETEEGVHLGGLWQIAERVYDPSAGTYRLELVQEGEDNGRPAKIRNLVVLRGDELTITKFVKYSGSDEELQRHQYRLRRSDA